MMRSLLFLFLICFVSGKPLRAQWNDDFSDGNFTQDPSWQGSSKDFTVNAALQLQSASTSSNSTFYLSTPSGYALDYEWELWCRLAFNPSSTNYVDIYLTADTLNLQSPTLKGYFLRLGNSQDEISLYRRNGAISTKLIDGLDGTLNTSNNTLRIRVRYDSTGLWSLERDLSGSGDHYFSEGTFRELNPWPGRAFGILIRQSSNSFFQKHYFDDLHAGPIVHDHTPPELDSLHIPGPQRLDLFFHEGLDTLVAKAPNHYTVSGGIGMPAQAIPDPKDLRLVHLYFEKVFPTAVADTISVKGVQDLAGNAVESTTLSFVYYPLVLPGFKDLIINEIMADPTPSEGLPAAEYLELYNRSSQYLQLKGLRIDDHTSVAVLPSYTLVPGAYVVLHALGDSALFRTANITPCLGLIRFPSLGNAGDRLRLRRADSLLVDSVSYNDTWYKDPERKNGGWSLELICPEANLSCPPADNWQVSQASVGGTPGRVNSIYSALPVSITPAPGSLRVLDSVSVEVCFDTPLPREQLQDLKHYELTNGPNISAVNIHPNNTCIDLILSSAMNLASNHRLIFKAMSNCNGQGLQPDFIDFSYYRASVEDVVFNELMIDPEPAIGLPAAEYIELKNRSAYFIDLKNWSLASASASKKLPEGRVPPGGLVVLINRNDRMLFDSAAIPALAVKDLPALSNYGSQLCLRDSVGHFITAMSYTSDWYGNDPKKEGGYSLEQIDPANPCAGSDNWSFSKNPRGGTPGKVNSVFALHPDQSPPWLERIQVPAPDKIVLCFNEAMDSLSLQALSTYSFVPDIGTPTGIFPMSYDFKRVTLSLPDSLQAGIRYRCSVNGLASDCSGNTIAATSSAEFALPELPTPGDLAINELLFYPNTGVPDFVEVYNRSKKTIDLRGLRLAHYDSILQLPKDLLPLSEDGYLLFPETYLVLSEDGQALLQHYSSPNPKDFLNLAKLPAMNADEGTVVLCRPDSVIIDRAHYTSSMHFPLLSNTQGVSLERINYDRPADDRSNWNSAAAQVGFATPAYRNSQYLQQETGDGYFYIPHALFSPDNDGFEDVLNIYYQLPAPGSSTTMRIYDANGLLVRQLLQNELLPSAGTLSWNGITDHQEKAPIGIYVVQVEWFTLSGDVRHYKLPCVLAGRL